jgi:hypothetical protein
MMHLSLSLSHSQSQSQSQSPIFRFKFSPLVIEELQYFGKLHQYDDRKMFKESWEKWIRSSAISSLFQTEIERLLSLGCRGNILDKMFKSSRYYHRKVKAKESKRNRCPYIHLDKSFLHVIDSHITHRRTGFPPSLYFQNFCLNHRDDIIRQIHSLMEHDACADATQSMNKIKKTYKTRLFNYS